MSSKQDDPQGRHDTDPFGQGPGGSSAYGGGQPGGAGPSYGQQSGQQYGPQYGSSGQQYGQPQYGGQQYGQPSPYGQPTPYGQPQYGQPAGYGQPGYPQQYGEYGQAGYGQYGQSAVPAKPAQVVVAAVLGFLFGAIGLLVTFGLLALGALATGADSAELEQNFPGFGDIAGAVGGAFLLVGLLALAWTVLMIWGSVWALTGRSRVLLLVGGSIALALTAFGFLGNLLGGVATGGDIVTSFLFFAAALAIVVLLSLRPAAQFYAAHRARRGR